MSKAKALAADASLQAAVQRGEVGTLYAYCGNGPTGCIRVWSHKWSPEDVEAKHEQLYNVVLAHHSTVTVVDGDGRDVADVPGSDFVAILRGDRAPPPEIAFLAARENQLAHQLWQADGIPRLSANFRRETVKPDGSQYVPIYLPPTIVDRPKKTFKAFLPGGDRKRPLLELSYPDETKSVEVTIENGFFHAPATEDAFFAPLGLNGRELTDLFSQAAKDERERGDSVALTRHVYGGHFGRKGWFSGREWYLVGHEEDIDDGMTDYYTRHWYRSTVDGSHGWEVMVPEGRPEPAESQHGEPRSYVVPIYDDGAVALLGKDQKIYRLSGRLFSEALSALLDGDDAEESEPKDLIAATAKAHGIARSSSGTTWVMHAAIQTMHEVPASNVRIRKQHNRSGCAAE